MDETVCALFSALFKLLNVLDTQFFFYLIRLIFYGAIICQEQFFQNKFMYFIIHTFYNHNYIIII